MTENIETSKQNPEKRKKFLDKILVTLTDKKFLDKIYFPILVFDLFSLLVISPILGEKYGDKSVIPLLILDLLLIGGWLYLFNNGDNIKQKKITQKNKFINNSITN